MQKFMARFMAYSKLIAVLFSFFLFFSKPYLSVYAQEASRFRFIVIGCAHFSAFAPKDYKLMARSIKEHNPDFVLFFSDTADSLEENPMLTPGDDFYCEIKKLNIPVFDFLNKRQLTGAAFMATGKNDSEENGRLFEFKNNLFIYPGSKGYVGHGEESAVGSRLNYLKNSIGDTSKYNNVFIFTRGPTWFGEEGEWAKTVPFLSESKIRDIFGPNMQYLDLKKTGNRYTMSKFMPCYLRRLPASPLHHFLVVDVEGRNAYIKFTSFAASSLIGKGVLPEREALNKFHIYREREREGSLLRPELIIGALRIKPGMDILDLGAGGGIFALPFAETLQGTGRVFATEVRTEWIETIKKRVKEKQLKNVFPVLVRPEGVDPFYKQNSFDIVFLCETYSALQRAEDYFRELKPSLKSGGRLYIMNRDHTISSSDFWGSEFGDYEEVIHVLISKGKGFPVFRRLEKEVRDFVENWHGEVVPLEVRTKIIRDFNKIISDRWFFKDLMDYYAREDTVVVEDGRAQPAQFNAFVSSLKDYKWVIVGLESLGVFDPPGNIPGGALEEPLRMFNRRLLTRIFDSKKQLILSQVKKKTISEMESAGYEFVREYSFLKDYYFLEFKSKL